MTIFDVGDVLLVHFPYTDLSSTKRRPAVVISSRSFGTQFGDMIVMPLTSQKQSDEFSLSDWSTSGLVKPTWVKPLIATISQQPVIRRLGQLTPRDMNAVRNAVRAIIDQRCLP